MFEAALNTVIDLTDSELTERFRELELQRRRGRRRDGRHRA